MAADVQVKKLSQWLGSGSINIFGMPFSGKDTQCQKLADILGARVVAGGDILRNHPDQKLIKKLMSTGKLFPQDLYLEIVTPYLSKAEFDGKPLVLSSLGRWHGEEEAIMSASQESGHDLKAVVALKLSEEEAQKRYALSQQQQDRGQRYDDAGNVLAVRFNEFRTKTVPVLDYYRKKGLLVEVDGSKPPQQVTQQILSKLATLANLS